MGRVTSKLQVTVPKAIADRYGIVPGQELDWLEAGDAIRVVPRGGAGACAPAEATARRIALFDAATERQRARDAGGAPRADARGWTRAELYERGRAG